MLRRRSYLPTLVGASVVAHTLDGRSIAGVVAGAYRDVLVLAHASLLVEKGEPVQLEGEQVIPRAQMAFLQTERA